MKKLVLLISGLSVLTVITAYAIINLLPEEMNPGFPDQEVNQGSTKLEGDKAKEFCIENKILKKDEDVKEVIIYKEPIQNLLDISKTQAEYKKTWGIPKTWVEVTSVYELTDMDIVDYSRAGPGGNVSMQYSDTIEATMNTEISVSKSIVSGSVGYTIGKGYSISKNYSRDITPGKYGMITAYISYRHSNFDIWFNPLLGGAYVCGEGWAEKPIGVIFKYSEDNGRVMIQNDWGSGYTVTYY